MRVGGRSSGSPGVRAWRSHGRAVRAHLERQAPLPLPLELRLRELPPRHRAAAKCRASSCPAELLPPATTCQNYCRAPCRACACSRVKRRRARRGRERMT
eukprot:1733994-Prymnesium_polylepis.2